MSLSLGAGETGRFDVVWTNYTATSGRTTIDNALIQGSIIPEPASLALLGLGGLLVAGRQRRGV